MERPEKNPPCPNCGFDGDFEYTWENGDFMVICPSCKETTHKVEKEKIDSLVQEMISGSIDQIKGAADEAKDQKKN